MNVLSQVMAGYTVLVTADRRSAELAAALERRGATVRHAPALSIMPAADDVQLLRDTQSLIARPPDIVVVTTGIGLRSWIEAADAAGHADDLLAVLGRARLIARGPKARGAIQAAGLTPAWVAESEMSAEIIEALTREGVAGQRIAVQHHGAGSDGLDEALTEAGADVASIVVYRWGPPADPEALASSLWATASGDVDAVVFTSAPGARAWLDAADDEGVSQRIVDRCGRGQLVVAAVGPVTAAPLEAHGIRPLVPDRARMGALVRALVEHYEQEAVADVETACGPLQVRSKVAILNGHTLALSPGALAVLRLLVSARGDVVTRGDLLGVLPGDSQDPHAAEVAVARLRESACCKHLVQTVVKRGYRLNLA